MESRTNSCCTLLCRHGDMNHGEQKENFVRSLPVVHFKHGYGQLIYGDTKRKRKSSSSSLSSMSSSVSGTSKKASDSSANVYSGMFWSQFSRVEKNTKEDSFISTLKKFFVLKDKKKLKQNVSTSSLCLTQTHPRGLYCVIDDFLSTYSDGFEYGTEEASDEYGEVVDRLEYTVEENAEYSEILNGRLYQNLADMNMQEKDMKNITKTKDYDCPVKENHEHVYSSISIAEYETLVE